MDLAKTTPEQPRSKVLALRLVLLTLGLVGLLIPTRVVADTIPSDSPNLHKAERTAARRDSLILSGPTRPRRVSHPSHARAGAERRARVREGRSSLSPRSGRASCGGGLTQDTANRLTQIDDTVGPYAIAYSYDNNGNTLTKTKSDDASAATTFEYDSRDHLVQVIRGPPGFEEVQGQYDYDANGLRVRVRAGSRGGIDYYYDGDAVIEERDATDDSLEARYHYGDRALRVDDHSTGSAEPLYYHQDALGTTTHLTRPDGSIAQQYKVDPWGRPRSGVTGGGSVLASANRKLFTGHEYDANTGLYYAKARYYDPDQGRFLTQDSYLGQPGMPPSRHRYLYVASNPTRYVDPTGHVYVDGRGEPVTTPEGAGLSSDYLEWSSADFEMADSELKYFCTTSGGGRECGIWTPGSGGGKRETAESRTGQSPITLVRPPEEVSEVASYAQPRRRTSARTLLQRAAAESNPRELTSTRAERAGAFLEGTLDWVPGVVKNVFDSGAFAMDLVAPKWEEKDGVLRRTKGRGLGWYTADFARDSLRGWSSSWEREWMFGRPDDPLLALSYDDGMRGIDAVSAVAPVGGTGAFRSMGSMTARARSVVAKAPVPASRTILGKEVRAPVVRGGPRARGGGGLQRALGSRAGHNVAGSVTPGGTGRALAGHGVHTDGYFVVPDGTSVSVWTGHGKGIPDAIGRLVEAGRYDDIAALIQANPKLLTKLEGARTYLPGARIPDYTLHAPTNQPLNIMEASTTVDRPTKCRNC